MTPSASVHFEWRRLRHELCPCAIRDFVTVIEPYSPPVEGSSHRRQGRADADGHRHRHDQEKVISASARLS